MLTDPGALVLDPFAGSCVTGEVCERLKRNWICVELNEELIRGAIGRLERENRRKPSNSRSFCLTWRLALTCSIELLAGALWNGHQGEWPLRTAARNGK